MKYNILFSKKTTVILSFTSVIVVASYMNVPPSLRTTNLPTVQLDCRLEFDEFKSWFETGTVTLDGVVKPANSVTFPDIPNCSFYKWSEQMFLYLTSPVSARSRYGGRGGRIFESEKFYDVSPMDQTGARTFLQHQSGELRFFQVRSSEVGPQGLPVAIESKTGRLVEIEKTPLSDSKKQLILNAQNKIVEIDSIGFDKNKKPIFFNKKLPILGAKPFINKNLNVASTVQRFTFPLGVTVQKVPSLIDILLDAIGNEVRVEQGQASGSQVLMSQGGSLVYYSSTVNEVFVYFRTMLGNTVPEGRRFPVNQADLNQVVNFANTRNVRLTDPEALALEIKTSWVEANTLAEPEKYIRKRAIIPTYNMSNPNNWIVNGQKPAELAMVGMHVVGSTKGHPEMLWATFEHVSNTPNVAYISTDITSRTQRHQPDPEDNWLFSSAHNSSIQSNEPHMAASGNGIISLGGFSISPSVTLRTHPWGIEGLNRSSNTEVISINKRVIAFLGNGDVRKNYIHMGTTWTINGAPPNGIQPVGNEVGTNRLANTTMETYQQGTNCFSCHDGRVGGVPTNTTRISHLFHVLKPLF